MDFETYRKLVVAKATEQLWWHNWFGGVCTNNIYMAYPDVERGVEIAISDTWHYDGVEE
jgi:hypothetical protein